MADGAKGREAWPAMSRREFTAASVMAMLAGVTVTLTGCGGGGGGSSSPTGPTTSTPTPTANGDKTGTISANHGHVAVVTAAEMTAGAAISLDIRGSSDHPHRVQLSADDIRQISQGTRVSRASSTDDGHDHIVTFN